MLEKLKDFAAKLGRLRIPALIVAAPLLLLLIWIVTTSNSRGQDIYLIPVLLLFIWLLLLYAFISLFASVPDRAEKGERWLRRQITHLHRGLYYLMALFMLTITIGLLITSLQLGSTWLRMY